MGNLRVACRCTEVKDTTKPEQGNPPIIVQQAHYDTWGLRLPFLGTDPNNDIYIGKPEDRFKYNGKEQQQDIGLIDYGARMYDPNIGRWGVIDPLADEPEQVDKSPYAYAWNNPVYYTDPDGRCPSCVIGGIIGAAVEYGTQVATNAYKNGGLTRDSFTKDINLSAIGLAAVEGAVTQGASAGVENY